jgi:hypothetical protein
MPGAATSIDAMDEQPILDRIEDIVAEEHRLYSDAEAGRLDEAGHQRLAAIRGELDRCWALLRRRRIDPDAPDTPVRDQDVPDPANDLEGPDPEPPHLEHNVHGDGPAPDPGIPREIP